MATSALEPGAAARTDSNKFVLTIFAGSFLLFLVQPMIARLALPRLGGAPAVWNSAMLVYQLLLLGGYTYAHLLASLAPRRQAAVHLGALAVAALMLPIGLLGSTPPPDFNPYLWVPWLLLVSIGPLFFVISAQAPLLQRWFSTANGGDPYPLYAASNLGSFGGLICYPLVVEPFMPLMSQSWLWSAGYLILVALVAWCALALPRHVDAVAEASPPTPRPAWRSLLSWALIAAVPSGLILSTTLHLTTDIVAMPLLWVLPLGVYLLSFSLAFGGNGRLVDAITGLTPIILILTASLFLVQSHKFALLIAGLSILNLFTVSVSLHRQLFDDRPDARHLTIFYLALSVGGVLGGLFCAVIAPLVFDWTYEHLLLLAAAAILIRAPSPFARWVDLWDGERIARRITAAGLVVLALIAIGSIAGWRTPAALAITWTIAIVAIGNRALFAAAIAALLLQAGGAERLSSSLEPGKQTRSFFGIYSIREPEGQRTLVHGTTVHGVQNLGSPDRERMPTSYYAPKSGVGLAMTAAAGMFGDKARIGVVGLGTGTLACYARPGQHWTFYEIDPVVAGIAANPARFTFLARCQPDAPIVIGDARLTLDRADGDRADILVVDAFSSDSIPVHLLTHEAFEIYRRRLSPEGLLLVHISNRFLDLHKVIAGEASNGGWETRLRAYRPTADERSRSYSSSDWVALSPSRETLDRLLASSNEQWTPVDGPRVSWSDQHASLLPVLKR